MKLHQGDLVVVISGKDKGRTGRILRVLSEKGRVVVAGANMRTRHMKKTSQQPGRIVRYEASLHGSNVMIIDPKTKKRVRVGYRMNEEGKKERVSRQSGELIASGRALKQLAEEERRGAQEATDQDKSGSRRTEGDKAKSKKKS